MTEHSQRRCRERRTLCCAACLPALLLAGCAVDSGPPRFELSGKITYNGQPVPVGYIVLEPDAAAGNSGPGGQADIRDGQYHTLPGRGSIGGPHVVSVFGFDGKPYPVGEGPGGTPMSNPMGRPLFEHVTRQVDLPKQTATHDFEIPRQESKN